MSYRFSVDLTALRHAADGVGEVLHGVAEFCSRWQRGVADLASEGQQIASRLNYAVQAYDAYEEATRRAAAEGGTAPGGIVSGRAPDPGTLK